MRQTNTSGKFGKYSWDENYIKVPVHKNTVNKIVRKTNKSLQILERGVIICFI